MQVTTSKTEWTKVGTNTEARIWDNKVWRKDFNSAYYGGYQIKTIPVGTRLAREWLDGWSKQIA